MKRFIIYMMLLVSLTITSCKKWLTIEPATQTTEKKLFQSKQGFSDALIGLYMSLRENYTPGQFMQGAGIDHMACSYTIGSTSMDYQLYSHEYTHSNADSKLATAFLNSYKVIANANNLLKALESQTILDKRVSAAIEGEARAIRAFVHFDLIRIWGPVPNKPADSRFLPYVTRKQTEPYDYETYSRYMQLLIEDLNAAEDLLKSSDPILTYSNSQLNTSSIGAIEDLSDLFWYYRQNRFNYYAVQALKARYYLWLGDYAKATLYAKEVVESKNADGLMKFSFADSTKFKSLNDYTMFEEQILGLHVQTFEDNTFSGINTQYANTVTNITDVLFDPTTSKEDVRLKTFFKGTNQISGGELMGTLKFSNMRQTTNTSSFSIPIIRISEMYLILAEAAPIDEANIYYKKYLEAKAAPVIVLKESNRKSTILKDYLREFYSEGQSFFAYKRNFVPTLLFSDQEMTEATYVPVLPSAELNPFQ